METSKRLNGTELNAPMLFAADILASLSAPQENEKDKTTPDTCGPGYSTPLADYDPNTQSWRMYGDISLWEEFLLLETLPPSGTTQNGELFLRPLWERLTEETESLLWPTPRANSAMAATITPETAHDPKRFPNLETVVGQRTWPTPRSSPAMAEDISIIAKRMMKPNSYRARLEEAVAISATPQKSLEDSQTSQNQISNSEQSPIGGKLNPNWVEWLMGFPPSWTDLDV